MEKVKIRFVKPYAPSPPHTPYTQKSRKESEKKKKKVSLEQEEEAISAVWLGSKHWTSLDHHCFICKMESLRSMIQCWDPVARSFSQALPLKPNYTACLLKGVWPPFMRAETIRKSHCHSNHEITPFSTSALGQHFMSGADILQSQFLGALGRVWRKGSSENMPTISGLISHAH